MMRTDPEPGRALWTGRARDTVWRVSFSAPILDERTGDAADQASATMWRLKFESESGGSFERTWSPQDRILFGTLAGWSKTAVGSLKRALIAWKPAGTSI